MIDESLLAKVASLSTADRLELIGAVWDTLSPDDLPITDGEKALLDARLADLVRKTREQSSWSEVRARLERLHRSASGSPSFELLKENNSMSGTLFDEAKLKEALKSAIVEILEERKDLVREVLEEALEDIALARAIEEGEQSELVTRDEVFKALEPNN